MFINNFLVQYRLSIMYRKYSTKSCLLITYYCSRWCQSLKFKNYWMQTHILGVSHTHTHTAIAQHTLSISSNLYWDSVWLDHYNWWWNRYKWLPGMSITALEIMIGAYWDNNPHVWTVDIPSLCLYPCAVFWDSL